MERWLSSGRYRAATMPRRWAHRPSTTSRFTNVGQPPHGGPAIGAPVATLGFAGRFTGWLDGQPASVGEPPNHCGVRSRARLPSVWPSRSELEITVTLPEPEATDRWRGRTLVDHHGEPLGSIEIIYLDKVTNQPEWALLEAGATGPAPTFVPLVSANEEGDTVRVPFAKTLVEGAPSMPADRELSEEQEGELYRHYGVPYSRADSPSGLPAGEPEPAEPALAAGGPQPAEEPVSASTPDMAAAGKPEVPAAEPTTAADEPLPAGGDALPEAAVAESAPIPASAAVAPAPGPVDEPVAEASATNDGLVASQAVASHRPTGRCWRRRGCPGGWDLAAGDDRSAGEHDGQPAWCRPGNGQPPAASAAPDQGPQPGGDRSDPADRGAGPGDGTTGRRHGPVAGNGYRAGWPAGAGRRPGDPESDQPGCQAGSAWSPQKATGRNPRHGRRWGRRVCAGGQGRPTALPGDHRVGQAVAATAGGQTHHRAGRGQA